MAAGATSGLPLRTAGISNGRIVAEGKKQISSILCFWLSAWCANEDFIHFYPEFYHR